jgi:4-hydroxy-2-oxoheptanedioate aldolase
MERKQNRFHRIMSAGTTRYGLWLGLPDNTAAEIAAGAGFDWLLVDHEHAPFELSDILSHLQVMAAYDVAPVVRPVDDNPALLKKLLDIGVQTFLVPMVESAEQAAAIVRALRYPPAGARGLGTSLARAADWGRNTAYLTEANDGICLLVQVETAAALERLPEIVAVDGVDGVFIGPSDLSASMGHVGQPGHEEVVAAVCGALSTIAAASRYAGVLCLDPLLAERYRASGASFIGVGVDTQILAKYTRELARACIAGSPRSGSTDSAGY